MGRTNFENELKQLHTEIIEMGSFVETAIEDSIRAFRNNDFDLCKKIIENDKTVDEMERKIESKCLWMIAREQPIANDLRKITAALKLITDMERIGDHASDIAELTMRIEDKNAFADSEHILEMATTAIEMVRDAVTSYVNYDLELAKATEAKDDIVDNYFNLIKQEHIDMLSKEQDNIDSAVDFLFIAKYLERIADHAVNICEWVHFSKTGEYKNTLIF
ncbi:MAG: phosphate signaling complex protein PhoU [Oscillospiraceae bacterium]|jgi:phosphate transport system protein|nr:phosphate signaling complex protein PhoU [Oscillospiraceae bacterium]